MTFEDSVIVRGLGGPRAAGYPHKEPKMVPTATNWIKKPIMSIVCVILTGSSRGSEYKIGLKFAESYREIGFRYMKFGQFITEMLQPTEEIEYDDCSKIPAQVAWNRSRFTVHASAGREV